MTRRKTDGERIADRVFLGRYQRQNGVMFPSELALDIDRLVRRRMAEAWEEGWLDQYNDRRRLNENPYRGRSRKK